MQVSSREKEEDLVEAKIKVQIAKLFELFQHSFVAKKPISDMHSDGQKIYVSTRNGRISSLSTKEIPNLAENLKRRSSLDDQGNTQSEIEERSFKIAKKIYCLTIWKEMILVGTFDGRIERYSLKGELLSECKAHKNRVYSLCVFQDLLYSCSKDHMVGCWDLELNNVDKLCQHTSSVRCLNVWKMKEVLISAGNDSIILVWKRGNDNTHQLVRSLPKKHNLPIMSV